MALGLAEEPTQNRKKRRTTSTAGASPDISSRWANLPSDIISSILKKLTLLSDYDRFGAVCVSWRQASLDPLNRNHRIESKIHDGVPLLLLPSDRLADHEQETFGRFKSDANPWKRTLFDVFNQTTVTHDFNLPSVPESAGRCCGSSHGWLIFADRYQRLTLVNPFYTGGGPSCGGGMIRLPSLHKITEELVDGWLEELELEESDSSLEYIPELHVTKAVLSADPALFPNDYAVAALRDSLFFMRPGTSSKRWTRVRCKKGKLHLKVVDVLFRGKMIYAVLHEGGIYSCDMTAAKPRLRKVAPRPPVPTRGPCWFYLAESLQGDILLVYRIFVKDSIYFPTVGFRVFKLLALGGGLTAWREMKNLGRDVAIFLGESSSTCVEILGSSCHLEFGQSAVYYTDDRLCSEGPADPFFPHDDMGVFNMEKRTIRPCYDEEQLIELVCIPPPVWFLPSLPGNWK